MISPPLRKHLPFLIWGGGGKGVEPTPKVFPQKRLVEIRYENDILANQTSIKNT